MNSERIKILEQFIADDPADAFNHYALALELLKVNRQEAEKKLDFLLQNFPDYLPAYYQAALLKADLSFEDQALKIIEQGIKVAMTQCNNQTVNELRSLMNTNLDE